MKFNYLTRTLQGEKQRGVIEAVSQAEAIRILQKRQLIIIKIQSVEETPLLGKRIKIFERIKRKEIFIFFRELAILAGADVPLVQSLRTLSQQMPNPYFKEIVFEQANEIDGGASFSKALSGYPKVFSDFQ